MESLVWCQRSACDNLQMSDLIITVIPVYAMFLKPQNVGIQWKVNKYMQWIHAMNLGKSCHKQNSK